MATYSILTQGLSVGLFGADPQTLCSFTKEGKVEGFYKVVNGELVMNENGFTHDDGILFNACDSFSQCSDGSAIFPSAIIQLDTDEALGEYWFVGGTLDDEGLFHPTASSPTVYIRGGKCGESKLYLDSTNPAYIPSDKVVFVPTTDLSPVGDFPFIYTGGDFVAVEVEVPGGNTGGGSTGGGGSGAGDGIGVTVVQSLPTATIAYEGNIFVVKGATNDRVYICMRKNGIYTWVPLDAAILR